MGGHAVVNRLVGQLAAFPAVQGCALVEADSGMVWYHAGSLPDIESTGEAGVEFWRVQSRLSGNFNALGGLQSAAYSYARHVVALFPCSDKPALVLVCIAQKDGMDWSGWGKQVPGLKRALAESLGEEIGI